MVTNAYLTAPIQWGVMKVTFLVLIAGVILLSGCVSSTTETTTVAGVEQTTVRAIPSTTAKTMKETSTLKAQTTAKAPETSLSPTTTEAPATTLASSPTTVSIKDFAFDPATVTVNVGAAVTWVNQDSAPHTVTSDSGGELSSGTLSNGQSYSHTFNAKGTYTYHCGIHRSMKGTVNVE